jgi:hypothetical protein
MDRGDWLDELEGNEAHDREIGHWQNAIAALLEKFVGHPVDGSGCDSGDPLDLTLAEVSSALSELAARGVDRQEPPPQEGEDRLVLSGEWILKFRLQRCDGLPVGRGHAFGLEESAIGRALEMAEAGYREGLLCEEVDGTEYRGWWEVVRR